jgi:hypothetical protein
MTIAAVLIRQDVSRHVTLVEPLHDDDDRRPIIVDAVRHRFVEEPYRLLSLQLAFGLDHIVRIVEDDAIAALVCRMSIIARDRGPEERDARSVERMSDSEIAALRARRVSTGAGFLETNFQGLEN